MTLRTISTSSELAAEELLAEAKLLDIDAYMYRDDDDEMGFYQVCYQTEDQV